MSKFVDIVFDGPPGPAPAPRFVEVEDESGASISFGKWVERDDGYWVLRISDTADALGESQQLQRVTADTVTQQDELLNMYSERIEALEAAFGRLLMQLANNTKVAVKMFDEIIEAKQVLETAGDSLPECEHDPVTPADTDRIQWGEYKICAKCRSILNPDGSIFMQGPESDGDKSA